MHGRVVEKMVGSPSRPANIAGHGFGSLNVQGRLSAGQASHSGRISGGVGLTGRQSPQLSGETGEAPDLLVNVGGFKKIRANPRKPAVGTTSGAKTASGRKLGARKLDVAAGRTSIPRLLL